MCCPKVELSSIVRHDEWTRRFFFAHLLVARAIGGFPLHPAEARTPERGRRRKAGRGLATFRAHTPNATPPPERARGARVRALLLEARRAAASLQRPRRSARVLLAPRRQPPPHTAHAIQRPAAADGGQARMRTALCATPGGAPGHRGGGGRPAPRPDAPRPRESAPVGVATSGGAPRAAAGAHSTLCVAHSAAGNASQAGRSEPLDALSLAQRQARDAPHRRTPTERTGPRACAHNAS